MPFTTPQRDWLQTWAFSLKKESAYGTILAFADLDKKVAFDESGSAQRTPNIVSDRRRLGKGSPFTTQDRIVAWDSRITRPVPLSTLTAGWILSFVLGKHVAGGVGPFTETLTFADQATGAQAPSTTIWTGDGGDLYRLPGMSCNSCEISWRAQEEVLISSEWIGSGNRTEGDHSAEPNPIAHGIVIAGDVVVNMDAPGEVTPADISDRILEGRIRISQNLAADLGYSPGAGAFRNRLWFGDQTVQVDLTLFDDGSGDIEDLVANRTKQELNFLFPFDANNKIAIDIPVMKWLSANKTSQGGFRAYQATTGDDGVYKDGTGTPDEPVQVVITTSVQQDLLVAAA